MSRLADEVSAIHWYHTIELPGGVITPGYYDHRALARRLPIPQSLAGKRCLDIGSSDGFWAFEMSRRGAEEVVSVDLEDASRQEWQGPPARNGEMRSALVSSDRWEGDSGRTSRAFTLANDALGAGVRRLGLSAYDISPETVGTFDFVFMGSLLLHLRDPAGALLAARSVTEGRFLLVEPVVLGLSLLFRRTALAALWPLDEPRWWQPNIAGLARLAQAAGFRVLEAGGPRAQKFGATFPRRPPLRWPTRPELWFWTVVRPFGVPSAWVLGEPAPPAAADPNARVRMPLLNWF